MIEQIERFCAELQVRALGKIELLSQCEIEIGQRRPDDGILRQIPKVPAGGRMNTHGSNQSDGVPSFVPGATLPQPAVIPLVWTVAPGARLGRSAALVP